MPKFGNVVWHGDNVEKKVIDPLKLRLKLAAEHLRGEIVKSISIPTREHGPSKPGNPPHADKGRLKQSIQVTDVKDLSVEVFSDVAYGIYHETGDRPFMRPAMKRERNTILRIVGSLPANSSFKVVGD